MRVFFVAALLAAAGLAAAVQGRAQAPAGGGNAQQPAQNKPASQQQPGSGAQSSPNSQSQANPFPEDTSTVPVLPNRLSPDLPTAGSSDAGATLALPGVDSDPVRSPDQADSSSDSGADYSSSQSGIDNLLPPDDEKQTGKKKKGGEAEVPVHHETAQEDLNVGNFYLDKKDWRAALSRFQSAMVLDPEEPEVYWGLAEANRRLGNFAEAKANYQKVIEYDPDSRHAKEARKALEDPQIAAAKAPAGQAQ
jgi:tetratricopeptide (TPR) repeat protein